VELLEKLGVVQVAGDLAGAVEDPVASGEDALDADAIEDVPLAHHRARNVGFLPDESDHAVAPGAELGDEVAAEKAGRAGDEIATHAAFVVAVRGVDKSPEAR